MSWSRRDFLKRVPAGFLCLTGCDRDRSRIEAGVIDELSDFSASTPGSPVATFLRESGKGLGGTKIRVLAENTPPSAACRELSRTEFTPLTGIEVDWISQPLDRVFDRIVVDTSEESGHHDLFYIDQSWRGRFGGELEELDPWIQRGDLALPGWSLEGFLPPLVSHLGTANGRLVAVPYDITIFIGAHRKDLLKRIGATPPATMDEWLRVCREVTRAAIPGVHGMTAQWKAGHYSLQCNMTAWLWGHGGSIFLADGSPAIGDEQAVEALNYMMELAPHLPRQARTWDWHDEWRCFARGEAALFGSWAEFFPHFDDPTISAVVGLCEPLPMPQPLRLRPPEACGFNETPGVSHQGGSGMGISRNSRHKEAAWVFLQWATSDDITVRSCLLGSGASATRAQTYEDPRILRRKNRIGPGTTRHLEVMRDAILHSMGTEPCHKEWAALSRDSFAVELGRMVTGQISPKDAARRMAQAAARTVEAEART